MNADAALGALAREVCADLDWREAVETARSFNKGWFNTTKEKNDA